MTLRWFALCWALVAAACSTTVRKDAQIVIVVDTDLAVPDELNEVVFSVRRVGADESLGQEQSAFLTGPNAPSFPLVLPIAPERDLESAVEVRVEGYLTAAGGARALKVRRIARVRFTAGETRLLRMDLVRLCVAQFMACEVREQTCGSDGECAPIDLSDLPVWSEPDAGGDTPQDGTPGADDGGVEDAGGDDAAVPERDRPVALALGDFHSCVQTARGRMFCWGKGDYGELGNGTFDQDTACTLLYDNQPHDCTPSPVEVTGLPAVTQISAGVYTTCAVHEPKPSFGGNLSCWGEVPEDAIATPSPIVFENLRIDDAVEVRVGGKTTCIRRRDKLPVCFGEYVQGELGNGSVEYPDNDTALASALGPLTTPEKLAQLAVGDRHACALETTGSVLCWGNNGYGQAGQARATVDALTPAPVEGLAAASTLAAFGANTCAIDAQGALYCWGDDTYGQLGTGQQGDETCEDWGALCSPTPKLVRIDQAGGGTVQQVVGGARFACARLEGGQTACWGDNEHGQLSGRVATSSSPVPIAMPAPLDKVAQVAAGAYHACAILTDERVVCWGLNDGGQLGHPPSEVTKSAEPLEVSLPL